MTTRDKTLLIALIFALPIAGLFIAGVVGSILLPNTFSDKPQAAPTPPTSGLDSFLEKNATRAMDKIERQVADDQIQQFKIALHNGGTVMDLCVQAGMVTAALLQAQDAEQYAEWKKIEKKTCSAAGLDR